MASIDAFFGNPQLLAGDTGKYIDIQESNREWMDNTPGRYAYRCLPLVMANQFGWILKSDVDVEVCWDGGISLDSIHFLGAHPEGKVFSHFGSGILTWSLPTVFRTPQDTYLVVSGPPNSPKRGIVPLEGIVETEWLPFPFTMNWKFTEPNFKVSFSVGEPIARVFPYPRKYIESFDIHLKNAASDPTFSDRVLAFSQSRKTFNEDLRAGEAKAGWQKHYMKGAEVDGTRARVHDTKLTLARPTVV
jgi:hypothetical protein